MQVTSLDVFVYSDNFTRVFIHKSTSLIGKWIIYAYANLWTSQLADWKSHGLDSLLTS